MLELTLIAKCFPVNLMNLQMVKGAEDFIKLKQQYILAYLLQTFSQRVRSSKSFDTIAIKKILPSAKLGTLMSIFLRTFKTIWKREQREGK